MIPPGPMSTFRTILMLLGAVLFAHALPAGAGNVELMEYDITWVGVSVGTMSVQSETAEDGAQVRSIRIWNRPWIALVYPVDITIECRIESTADGPLHVVVKKVAEKNFTQDDTLVLWPEAGRAIWTNAAKSTVREFEVPAGSRDFVSFFYDLRDAAAAGSWGETGDYQLVMDGGLHPLTLQVGPSKRVRTRQGRLAAIAVQAKSSSPDLFSRNHPRSVWVSADLPVVLLADVDTRFGAVRATLAQWQIDGESVLDRLAGPP
jgi:hypothetical protein